jgi:hypothetical protein
MVDGLTKNDELRRSSNLFVRSFARLLGVTLEDGCDSRIGHHFHSKKQLSQALVHKVANRPPPSSKSFELDFEYEVDIYGEVRRIYRVIMSYQQQIIGNLSRSRTSLDNTFGTVVARLFATVRFRFADRVGLVRCLTAVLTAVPVCA